MLMSLCINYHYGGKGYDRNDKQIKLAEDAIEEYNRLKNKNK